MAIDPRIIRRPSDRGLFIAAAVIFPLLVLVGYFKTYYFRAFFDVPEFGSWLVHLHAVVMTAWVLYFVAQVALVKTKNFKLHMTMGMAGIGLAAIVVVVGMATAWNSHIVRRVAPAGLDPHSFFIVPTSDMVIFIFLFAAAIYWRKRPAEHKTMMLMTALNFSPAAIARIPILPPELMVVQSIVFPIVLGLACFGYYTFKHRKINRAFAVALTIFIVWAPLKMVVAFSEPWLDFVAWLSGSA